jgi:BirA family biotin operon repressor/biotin-[acetyl-CoA-carboxylase] ligase
MDVELDQSIVQSALTTNWIGRSYHHFDNIGSTNLALKEMLTAGDDKHPPAGTVLLAEYQSQGRGRHDRQWLAPSGTSLLLSVLLRPYWPTRQLPWLNVLASLAVASALEATTGVTAGVKWPNDVTVIVNGAWHKVSGLLVDGNIDVDDRLESAILGIGINVNIPPDQLPETAGPITSLLAATGKRISRLDLMAELLTRLETYYEAAQRGSSPLPEWKHRLVTLGQTVKATYLGDALPLVGVAENTDEWGNLLVRDNAGKLHRVSAGDVTLRR